MVDLPKENYPIVNINLFKTEPFESSYKVDLEKKVINMQIKIKILPIEKNPFRIKFQMYKKTGEGKFLEKEKIGECLSDPIKVISKPPQKVDFFFINVIKNHCFLFEKKLSNSKL